MKLITIAVGLCFSGALIAQTQLAYSYDARGNRILKHPTGNKRGNSEPVEAVPAQAGVFPNPTADNTYLWLKVSEQVEAVCVARIANSLGQVLRVYPSLIGPGPHKIELSDFGPGVYSITVCGNDLECTTEKIVVQ